MRLVRLLSRGSNSTTPVARNRPGVLLQVDPVEHAEEVERFWAKIVRGQPRWTLRGPREQNMIMTQIKWDAPGTRGGDDLAVL